MADTHPNLNRQIWHAFRIAIAAQQLRSRDPPSRNIPFPQELYSEPEPMKNRLALFIVIAALAAGCSSHDLVISLDNQTAVDLVPYPVVTSPPPPHRESDPANTLPAGSQANLDPNGFNPLYYHADSKRGVLIQFDVTSTPAIIFVRGFHYQVEPGKEGTNPALQPTSFMDWLFEISKNDVTLTLKPDGSRFLVEFSEE